MTKRFKAKKKVSRSLGVSLWGRKNDPFLKRGFRPGQHGTETKRETSYGIHLKAKQKVRKYYNIRESQFRNLFEKSRNMKGTVSDNFAGLLESRLVSVVYRANFAPTIYSARQLVSHKHILVNDKVVNISSYLVAPGDVVKINDKARGIPIIVEAIQNNEREIPSYLHLNHEELSVKLLNRPIVSDIPYPFEVEFNYIIELYSR
jgi:small subunit ribosomal protein S4